MHLNFKHILIGWARRFGLIRTPEDIEELSQMRLKICEHCKLAEYSKILEILNGNAEYVNTLCCSKCGCPCLEKSLVLAEKCPINKW